MTSNTWAGNAPANAAGSHFDRGAAVTRSLLGYGVLVGPFYLAVGLTQAFVRDGFDFKRHALSHLANGPGGWVQVANFVLCGAMVIAAAVGFARVLRPQSRTTSWFLAAFGASMMAAALFRADPVDGFPPGTLIGPPTTISTTGLLHFAAGAIGFVALAVSCFAAARALAHRKQRSMARLSLGAGLVVLVGFFAPAVLPGAPGIAGIWLSVIAGWAWLATTSIHLYRTSPDPNCEPRTS